MAFFKVAAMRTQIHSLQHIPRCATDLKVVFSIYRLIMRYAMAIMDSITCNMTGQERKM
jgi:hypothetical protein